MANFRIWIFLVNSPISCAALFLLVFLFICKVFPVCSGSVEIYSKRAVLGQCVIFSFGLSVF